MPDNPEREGSPRLMSINEIAVEYGVSRTTVHTYRRSGSFPQPAPVGGTEKTKLRFRADEVAAWFAANPKQQGKRTDLADKTQQGEPMATTVDPRTQALNEAADALVERAQELSVEAEEEMRRDLEEKAQVWHEAAELVRGLARKKG